MQVGGEAAWVMSMGSGINDEVWRMPYGALRRGHRQHGHATCHAPCTGDGVSSTTPMQAALQLLLLRLLLTYAPFSARKRRLHTAFTILNW